MENQFSYTVPSFLQGQSVDEIHKRMLAKLPKDIDTSEGQFPWDFTRPTAIEKAEMVEYQLNEAIQLIFPFYAYGTWLDLHAANRGMTRKEAIAAKGTVTITGTAGTVIPAGTLLYTVATGEKAAVEFRTDAEGVIPSGGTVDLAITAVEPGINGNVSAGTIILLGNSIAGVTAVTNQEVTAGGMAEEDDESLRERLLFYDQNQGVSFVGSIADYKRWALEVDGVGAVTVIPPETASGKIELLLVDSAGNLGDTTLCTAVYQHIMAPNNPEQRLAPINAALEVKAPTAVTINISGQVKLDTSTTVDTVKTQFATLLKACYPAASEAGTLKYSQVVSLLLQIPGVTDYSEVTVNSGTANITIAANEYPVTGQVVLTV